MAVDPDRLLPPAARLRAAAARVDRLFNQMKDADDELQAAMLEYWNELYAQTLDISDEVDLSYGGSI